MKIVFLCGSLEPGRDGVGDYTRRLAMELLSNGHEIGAIALNDQHLKEKFDGICTYGNIDFPMLRLPSILSKSERLAYTKEWIDLFDPLWLSLQFVPFAFHPKGLPFNLSSLLSKLGKGRLWHIMFHELWVGMDSDSTKKHIYWGKLQRYLIRSLIVKLRPAVIHTQSRLYILQLSKLGFKTHHLPLFSNIPVIINTNPLSLDQCIGKTKKDIYLVVFGTIHPGSQIHELINEMILYAEHNEVIISVKLIGRSGEEQNNWVAALKSAGVYVDVLGEQSTERISEVLANAAMGISTCAFPIIDKSGTVAAMLEHKLPVLCVARPWFPRSVEFEIKFPGVVMLKRGAFEACLSKCHSETQFNSLADVSRTLITRLEVS